MGQIRLTEKQLNSIIREAVEAVLDETEELEEGWFGDKWNQTKSAASTMFNKDANTSMRDRFNNATSNWNNQGELNKINNLLQQLRQFIEDGKIDPNTTVAQLVGEKNRFGKLTSKAANMRSQIARKGGNHY